MGSWPHSLIVNYETIYTLYMYVGNEGVKRNIKLEEQNSEIIK